MKGVGDKVVSLAQRRLRATEEVRPPTFLCSQGPTLESWGKLELCDTRAGGASLRGGGHLLTPLAPSSCKWKNCC